jgi:predicted NACHT family NTPase
MSMYIPTLQNVAALLSPFSDFITSISWRDGELVDVLISEAALRHFGTDWYPNHPVWVLFDALDLFAITYGYEMETAA